MINLKDFPKQSGVYWITSNNEVIYVGSSKNLYQRMTEHNTYIRKGSDHGYKEDLYQFLQSNQFIICFRLETNYKELEQELIEKYHPKYNSHRAYTGVAWNGNKTEYNKEHYQKFKEEKKQINKKYKNQLCLYNNEALTLHALSQRFQRKGVSNPTEEAKKYLIK